MLMAATFDRIDTMTLMAAFLDFSMPKPYQLACELSNSFAGCHPVGLVTSPSGPEPSTPLFRPPSLRGLFDGGLSPHRQGQNDRFYIKCQQAVINFLSNKNGRISCGLIKKFA